ncbi:glycoside hydrolase family 2 protein [Aequorivita sp. H23M31]|uniref:Beta-mannosidase B n=1 Tax=Aequorivita ciconiae TaxID=2494375 RepID=A0A410G5B0_9FLAO|nr:glycoside hydrolase family 2 protein [Aequorivita sp. H23M31]QAA82411.1 glycoside hydrolase family 2 protein [Aequorivita sp. H23M31]
MKIPQLLFLLFVFLFFSCKESGNDRILLNDGWQFSDTENINWRPAEVPGTVQSDLLRLGKIPDPFLRNNEDSIQWVSTKNWQYEKEFSLSPETLKRQKNILNFDGLDTYAEVFLNDSLILTANNAFRKWEVDVSNILQSKNKLLVIFTNIDAIEKVKAAEIDYTLPDDGRVFTRKPQYQSGWDWGPVIKTMGIWREVSLLSYDTARMTDVFLQTNSISDTLAKIVAKIEIESIKDEDLSFKIHNKTTGETFTKTFQIVPNQQEFEIPFTIKNPKLWWTHNLGEPFLYDIQVDLIHKGNVLEKDSKKLGIRTIELVTEKDSIGESFYFNFNGKPVYMKGANYIPQQMIEGKVNRGRYMELINDAVLANMNMLRVWGGGIYEDGYFYDLCDQKGILVWQDFMFAGGMYPGNTEFLSNVKEEAIYNVKRLRNHASIALWCGNNEISEGWARWGWQDDKTAGQKKEIAKSYQRIFTDILPKVVDSLNSSIDYWESSPKYGRGDKRYQFEGDAHDWWVWHDGYPFEHFDEEVPRFMSEFGFQAFPNVETIEYATGRDSVIMNDPLFANHQKHKRGFQIIDEYMVRDFPVPTNAEDYVYVSQLLQAYGITKGIHAHRRAKPYNMGTLYWQLNDVWPVVSWSSIDYLGNWKSLQYEVKKAFENVLISTETKNDSVAIFIVNDTFKKVSDTLLIEIMDFDGRQIFQKKIMVESPENSSKIVYTILLKDLNFDKRSSVLKLDFGKNEYLHYFVKPKDLQLKAGIISGQEECQVEPALPAGRRSRNPYEGSESNVLDFTQTDDSSYSITLCSKTLQKNVFLNSDSKGRWSDNFFDLLPNLPKTVYFYTDSKSPSKLRYKTLNQLIN